MGLSKILTTDMENLLALVSSSILCSVRTLLIFEQIKSSLFYKRTLLCSALYLRPASVTSLILSVYPCKLISCSSVSMNKRSSGIEIILKQIFAQRLYLRLPLSYLKNSIQCMFFYRDLNWRFKQSPSHLGYSIMV